MGIIVADVLTIVTLVFIDYPFQWLFGWSVSSLFSNFDKVLHFTAGMLLADIYYCLPFQKTFLRVFGFAFAIAVLWECVEPFFGFLGIGEPYAVFTAPWAIDTIGDIASVVIGGTVYYFFRKLHDTYVPAQ